MTTQKSDFCSYLWASCNKLRSGMNASRDAGPADGGSTNCHRLAVLSDINTERPKLVALRDKTRKLKQAVMQERLTGRIRLI